MNIALSRTFLAACFTALMAASASPAQAQIIIYQVNLPGIGTGTFRYNSQDITSPLNDGNYQAPLTDLTFLFNGWNFSLADIPTDGSGRSLAWFADPGQTFVGIEYYEATHNTDSIRFDPGFGAGDLGTFTANGGNPVALTQDNFKEIPEPGSLSCLLLGIGLGFAGLKHRRAANL